MSEHSVLPAGEIHGPHQWAFANAAARVALNIGDPREVGKIALQLDDGSYWRLTGVNPATWTPARSKYTPQVPATDLVVWVRSDGSNGNEGSADDAAHAFLTIQYAMNSVAQAVFAGTTAEIRIGVAGSYVGGFLNGGPPGNFANGYLKIIGNVPGVVVTETANSGFFEPAALVAGGAARILPENLRVEAATGSCMVALEGGIINMSTGIVFGACGDGHLVASNGGGVYKYADYTIDGPAVAHEWTFDNAWMEGGFCTITINGIPNFSTAYALPAIGGQIWEPNIVFVGTATGQRFQVNHSTLLPGTDSWNYYPGNVEGSISSGRYGNFFGGGNAVVAANLPAATDGIVNTRAAVLDATLPMAGNYGAAVVGGGANKVPVICLGAALGWRIG